MKKGDFFSWKDGEAKQIKDALAPLKRTSAKRYHVTHACEIMALSMGIKGIAHVPADKLYLWAFKRYEKMFRQYSGKSGWPTEALWRTHIFHYARDLALKQLKKGGAR